MNVIIWVAIYALPFAFGAVPLMIRRDYNIKSWQWWVIALSLHLLLAAREWARAQ